MTKPDYVYVTWILSTADKVWSALQDPEMTKQFWGVHKNVSDWTPGSDWKHVDYDDPSKVAVSGKVLVADRPRKLVLTWVNAMGASKVTFDLEEQFGAVKLTVTHEDLSEQGAEMVKQGWPAILSSLKTLLETGKPMPGTTRRWGR